MLSSASTSKTRPFARISMLSPGDDPATGIDVRTRAGQDESIDNRPTTLLHNARPRAIQPSAEKTRRHQHDVGGGPHRIRVKSLPGDANLQRNTFQEAGAAQERFHCQSVHPKPRAICGFFRHPGAGVVPGPGGRAP